jgi:hypothetical protein
MRIPMALPDDVYQVVGAGGRTVEDRGQEDRAHVFAIDGSPASLVSCGDA